MGETSKRPEVEYDLDMELDWLDKQEEVSDGFDAIYKTFWQNHDQRWKPAVSGITFMKQPLPPVQAYVPGFVYAGCIQALAGPPKAGKSTFVWSMIEKLMSGRPFLDRKCELPGSVLYVSEQSRFSFDVQLRRMPNGLREKILGNSKFFMMLPEHHQVPRINDRETTAAGWAERVGLWKKAVANTKADLLVIDTFNAYADLGPQGENDNAMIGSRFIDLRRLQDIAEREGRPSLAILLLCHTTKASSKRQFMSLRDTRGGSALAGALDHGVMLQKPTKGGNARFLQVESRMQEDTKQVVLWMEDGEYAQYDQEDSIRGNAEALGISFRQARAIYASLGLDKDESEENDVEEFMPKVTQ